MFDSVLHRPMKCCCENYQIMLNRLKLKTKGLHIYDVHKKKTILWICHLPYLQKWAINLLFKNNSIRKHVNFQGPSLFCVDVKNICSPRHFQIITPLLKKFSYKNSHLEQFNTMFKLGSNLLRWQISITFFNLLRYEFFFC